MTHSEIDVESLSGLWVLLKQASLSHLAKETFDKIEGGLKPRNLSMKELMFCWMQLEASGIDSEQVWKLIEPKIQVIERKDWMNHQICGDFPQIDPRCFAFCCTPLKHCPYRRLALKKLGGSDSDYVQMKKNFGDEIESSFRKTKRGQKLNGNV